MTTLDPQALAEIVRNSRLFDAQWYQQEYPEIEYHPEGNPDPAFHYANYGYKESRLPSVLFDGNKYSAFHNLRDINPLVHYLEHGARGDYSVTARTSEIMTKASLGGLMCVSERIFYLCKLYSTVLKQNYNPATQEPATLSEKLFYLHALSEGKDSKEHETFLQKAKALCDYNQTPETLKAMGLSDADLALVQKPALVFKSVKDLDVTRLPNSFRLKFNGNSISQLFVRNKNSVKPGTLHQICTQEQQKAALLLKQDALSISAGENADIVIYDLSPLQVHDREAIPHKVELWCLNGKVEFSLHFGDNNTIGIYDRSFNLEPSDFITASGALNAAPVAKCACFERMVEFAERCAQDRPFLSVSFITTGEDLILDEIQLYPYNCFFLCSNDFALKSGAKLQLPD